jgi:hypothetical protein
MEVRLFPNFARPGVGMKPSRESSRPLLPQHSRHCPVLEAGSALGYLVYPALKQNESFHIEYQGDGRYRIVYFLSTKKGQLQPVFALTLTLPMGSIGMMKEEVQFMVQDPRSSEADAVKLAKTFIIPEDFGTPPGAVALRGATNFQTPEGWDTVYAPVFNMIDRPLAPMMVVRVETDWYAHSSEFRYVLQPGEGLPGSHSTPVGQVFFVPREEVTMRDCTTDEVGAIRESMKQFIDEKEKQKQMTPFGLTYSPHYAHKSSAAKSEARDKKGKKGK